MIASIFRPQTMQQLIARLVAAGLLLTAVLVFLELAEDVWVNEGFAWDATIMLGIHSLSSPWLDRFFMLVTQTAGPLIVLPVLGTAVWFWRRDRHLLAALFIISFAGMSLLNALLKLIFARPRPDLFPPLIVEHSYSFPSGHTMAAISYYGLLALVLWEFDRRWWAVLAGLWVPLVALSRVYLGAHYPSDVLASLAVGTIWLVMVWFAYTGWRAVQGPDNAEAT